MIDKQYIDRMANNIRISTLEAIHEAGTGHPGGSLSAADIIATLYFYKMNIDPKNPRWADRDRFVISKGHSCPILYAALAEKDFFNKKELKNLRKIDSFLQGHPDMKNTPGIDMSTGSLGQGLSAAVGMAYSGKMDKKNYKVYCLTGCGESQEGQIWEAVMSANHFKLDNLVVIVDYNCLQIDGRMEEIMDVGDIGEKYKANNWNVIRVDGHNTEEIANALNEADTIKGKPTVIVAKTIKGKGVSFMEDQVSWHGKALNIEQLEEALIELKEENNDI